MISGIWLWHNSFLGILILIISDIDLQDLKELIDPSKNMSKYRSYVGSEHVQPPMVSNLHRN